LAAAGNPTGERRDAPMQDFCPIKRVDHLELYVGNAKQAAAYYARLLGFSATGYRGPETGDAEAASYVLEQRQVRLVLTSALSPDHHVSQFVFEHGDGVGVIALEVPNAAQAFAATTSRGAEPAIPPTETHDEHGVFR